MKTRYELIPIDGQPFAWLKVDGRSWAKLWLGGSADTTAGPDETMVLKAPSVTYEGETRRFVVEMESSAWSKKRFVMECHPDYAEAWLELTGSGKITDLTLFGGTMASVSASGPVSSQAGFGSVYSPAPGMMQRWVRSVYETQALSVGGSALPGQSDWFFTPPPSCFAVSQAPAPVQPQQIPEGPWMGICVFADPGEHNFTDYEYHAGDNAFCLKLRYGGQTEVNGLFRSPSVVLTFGHATPQAALEDYARQYGRRYGRQPRKLVAPWWTGSMFCGWGAQQVLAGEAKQYSGPAITSRSTQSNYDDFLRQLALQGLLPQTVVIDDKWQHQYGTNTPDRRKWPQLRKWIEKRHSQNQHVLLWLKLWDPEGLPAEECIVNQAGTPVAADPTNPAYERRLRRSVRQMLSSSGYDADGFKLDFSGRIPVASSLKRHGTPWGLELQRQMLSIIYSEAKRVKPDALIIAHAPHPYLVDVLDMLRLNDVVVEHPVWEQMQQRAQVVRAVCPGVPIDADNWPMPNLAEWRRYMAMSGSLGVPALYFATGVPDEPFTADDFAIIRSAWYAADERTA